jgi:hypothetical protein
VLSWREREVDGLGRRRWAVRTAAQADVRAPDGRRYAVRVVRIIWPRRGAPIEDLMPDNVLTAAVGGIGLLTSRRVWSVRVFGGASTFGVRPFVYGQEWGSLESAVRRAREIAEGLAAGHRP